MLRGWAGAAKWNSSQPLLIQEHQKYWDQFSTPGSDSSPWAEQNPSAQLTLSAPHILSPPAAGKKKKKNVPNASLIPPRITPRVSEEASKQPNCDDWLTAPCFSVSSALQTKEPVWAERSPWCWTRTDAGTVFFKDLWRSHSALNVTSEVARVNVMNVLGVSVLSRGQLIQLRIKQEDKSEETRCKCAFFLSRQDCLKRTDTSLKDGITPWPESGGCRPVRPLCRASCRTLGPGTKTTARRWGRRAERLWAARRPAAASCPSASSLRQDACDQRRRRPASPDSPPHRAETTFTVSRRTGWFQGGWRTATDATSGRDFQNKASQTHAALVYSKPLRAVHHTALRLV